MLRSFFQVGTIRLPQAGANVQLGCCNHIDPSLDTETEGIVGDERLFAYM
jgi:hypothetical protein